jgi:hypothetical protein
MKNLQFIYSLLVLLTGLPIRDSHPGMQGENRDSFYCSRYKEGF